MTRTQQGSRETFDEQKTEQRAEGRQKLILRVGLLEQDGKSIFCLVKNISASGVQVKPFGSLAKGAEVSLRVGDENPIPAVLMWSRNGLAGLMFRQTLNPRALLRIGQKMLVHRRRTSPRIVMALNGSLRTGGRKQPIIICDLSMAGARVRAEGQVRFGDTAFLDIPGLPSLIACVRWSDGAEFGVSFHPPLPMQILSELLAKDRSQGPSLGADH
jgi:hypothetical protein